VHSVQSFRKGRKKEEEREREREAIAIRPKNALTRKLPAYISSGWTAFIGAARFRHEEEIWIMRAVARI